MINADRGFREEHDLCAIGNGGAVLCFYNNMISVQLTIVVLFNGEAHDFCAIGRVVLFNVLGNNTIYVQLTIVDPIQCI